MERGSRERAPAAALVAPLASGPLDIIGDVHGEIEALEALLTRLGYDAAGEHPGGRRLVFVGDLVDRGPDSPAVLARVRALVEGGRAQCIVGNHELNLLRDVEKDGNGWWVHAGQPPVEQARTLSPAAKSEFRAFLATLPLVLERPGLRVVHACWNGDAVAALRAAGADGASVLELYHRYLDAMRERWRGTSTAAGYREAWSRHGDDIRDPAWRPVLLPDIAAIDSDHQMSNPVAVVTSGEEAPADAPFWAGGKWRMVERVKWWERYRDADAVIVGHYWRRFSDAGKRLMDRHGPDLFAGIAPHHWMGPRANVYCVDFSVGGRYVERRENAEGFHCRLAALRVPEWQVLHDDGEAFAIGPPGGAQARS